MVWGTPKEEYPRPRHNTGRMVADFIERKEIGGIKIHHLDTFMNLSGKGVAKIVKSKKAAEKLIVIHDDIDMPLGKMKIVFARGSGGHRGVLSVMKAIKTENFIRIKIGVLPTTPGGKLKKPKGEREVERFILGEFKKPEAEVLKKVFKKSAQAVEVIASEGVARAMNLFN